MRKEEFGNATKALIIVGYWGFGLLMIGLLLADLVPFCNQGYPKVSLGLALYAPEAFLIILAAGIGIVFTYLRVMSIVFSSITDKNAIYSTIMLVLLIMIESAFLFKTGCF